MKSRKIQVEHGVYKMNVKQYVDFMKRITLIDNHESNEDRMDVLEDIKKCKLVCYIDQSFNF